MKWMHLLRKAWKESNICTKSVVQIYQLSHHVEMDTAIGRIGGTALLTLTFTCCNFMVGLILPDKSATSVFAAILTLKNRLLRSGTTFVHYVPVLPD